jgi:hypothetical protein
MCFAEGERILFITKELCRRQRNRAFAREMRVEAALSRKGSSVFSLSLFFTVRRGERNAERVRNCLCFSLLNGSFFF